MGPARNGRGRPPREAPSRRRPTPRARPSDRRRPRRGAIGRSFESLADQLDFVFELDAEALADAASRFLHERMDVGRASAAEILDEVAVFLREAGVADAVTT